MDNQRRFGRHWPVAAVVALLAMTVLSATVEAGILLPSFRLAGTGTGSSAVSGDSSYSNIFQNVSLRSWTVTGVHLANRRSRLQVPGVTVVQLGLQHETFQVPSDGGFRPLRRLSIGPGQQFTVSLVEKQVGCPRVPAFRSTEEATRFFSSPAFHQHSIPAVITVATPLGSKTIATTFSISCPT